MRDIRGQLSMERWNVTGWMLGDIWASIWFLSCPPTTHPSAQSSQWLWVVLGSLTSMPLHLCSLQREHSSPWLRFSKSRREARNSYDFLRAWWQEKGREGRRGLEGKELSKNVISAAPTGSSECELHHRNCPSFRQGPWTPTTVSHCRGEYLYI